MTKPLFPYDGKVTRKQLEFFVAVCIASVVDHVEDEIPGRWFGREEDTRAWHTSQKNAMRPKAAANRFINDLLMQLGWNLSILYAQTNKYDDGMGVSSALEIAELGDKIKTWATDWLEGRVGVIRDKNDPHTGQSQRPDVDQLAKSWVNEVLDFKYDTGGTYGSN